MMVLWLGVRDVGLWLVGYVIGRGGSSSSSRPGAPLAADHSRRIHAILALDVPPTRPPLPPPSALALSPRWPSPSPSPHAAASLCALSLRLGAPAASRAPAALTFVRHRPRIRVRALRLSAARPPPRPAMSGFHPFKGRVSRHFGENVRDFPRLPCRASAFSDLRSRSRPVPR